MCAGIQGKAIDWTKFQEKQLMTCKIECYGYKNQEMLIKQKMSVTIFHEDHGRTGVINTMRHVSKGLYQSMYMYCMSMYIHACV
jgi:hypothetical protein